MLRHSHSHSNCLYLKKKKNSFLDIFSVLVGLYNTALKYTFYGRFWSHVTLNFFLTFIFKIENSLYENLFSGQSKLSGKTRSQFWHPCPCKILLISSVSDYLSHVVLDLIRMTETSPSKLASAKNAKRKRNAFVISEKFNIINNQNGKRKKIN